MLTQKQKLFIENIIKGENFTRAAINAGYSAKTAQEQSSRLLSNAIIIAEMAKRRAKIEAKTDITVNYIQSEHKRIMSLAEQKGDLSTATANLTGLGRTIAAYSDNINQSNTNIVQDLSADDIAELKRIASAATNIKLVSNHKTA